MIAARYRDHRPGHLTFGTSFGGPPGGFLQNGKPTGDEVEIAQALAAQMCLQAKFVNLNFAGLFPALSARKFDAAIAGIGITVQRQETYDFVPYFLGGIRLVVKKGSGLYFHNELAFAREVADRAVMMHGGVIVEEAPPASFFTAPRHERTRAFLSKIL